MLALWEFSWNPWPAAPQTVSAALQITSTLSKATTLSSVGSAQAANSAFSVPTSSTPLTLPVGSATGGVNFVYIKNVGNFPVQVTWTPFQGASNIVDTIQPGGFLCKAEAAIGSGITAISVQAIGGASQIDYLLVG